MTPAQTATERGVPNLVLVGYRGAGKSTLARKLTRLLKMPMVSTDETLVARFGRSIAEEVAEVGWPAFRDAETEVVKEASLKSGFLIDCGGGVVERPENVAALRETGLVFYLSGTVKTLAARIAQSKNRPSLTGTLSPEAEVAQVMEKRDPLYRAAAHHIIDVNGRRFYSAAEAIAKRYRQVVPAPNSPGRGASPRRRKRGGGGRRGRSRRPQGDPKTAPSQFPTSPIPTQKHSPDNKGTNHGR